MLTGPEHYREADRLLSDASFTDFHGNPVDRNGNLRMPGALEFLIARAKVHATLAQAAANVLPVVTQMCGDSNRVTAWAKAIGATDDGMGQVAHTGSNVRCDDINCACQDLSEIGPDGISRACELELFDRCPGCAALAHLPPHTCADEEPDTTCTACMAIEAVRAREAGA